MEGIRPQHLSRQQDRIKELFKHDANGDGKIDQAEFKKFAEAKKLDPRKAEKIFQKLSHGDGSIDRDDIKKLLNGRG